MAARTKVQLRLGDRVVAEIAFHNSELRIGEHVLTISVGDGEDAQASRTGESEVWETAPACLAPELAPRSRAASTHSGEILFAAGEGPVAEVAEERAASAAPVGAAPPAGRRPAISLDLPDPEGRFAIEEEDLVGGRRPDAASILPRFSEYTRARVRGQVAPAQAAELADPLHAGLIVERAGKVERVVPFHGAELVVGSGPNCDLVLSTAGISRHHALFVREAGGVRVLDLDSAHGLRVNGERATEQVLQFGDVVAIDDYALAFVLVLVLDREPLDHAVRSGAAASSVGSVGQLTARHSAPLVSLPERDLVTESDDDDLWLLEKEL